MEYFPKLKPENYFFLANGQIVKNLDELSLVIQRIDGSTFENHVTPYKNDFARWIYDVYMLKDLASEIGRIKSKEELARVLRAYVKQKGHHTTDDVKDNIVNAQETVVTQSQTPQQSHPHQQSQKPQPQKQTTQNQKTQQVKKPSPIKYVWRSSDSVLIEDHKKEDEKKSRVKIKKGEKKEELVQQQEEKEEEKKEEEPKEIRKPELKKPEPLPKPKLRSSSHNITDADKYFIKNPVLTEHRIEAKKQSLELKPLETTQYTGNESAQELIDKFNDVYSRAYQRISELRKAGFDTDIAEVMLFRIPPKINVYKSTNEKKDATLIKRYLNEIIEELNNLNT